MPVTEDEIVAAVLAMPEQSRAEIAKKLLESLEHHPKSRSGFTLEAWIAKQDKSSNLGDTEKFQQKPHAFWRRPPNAELDRVGDWLLENLQMIRQESNGRGDTF